MTIPLGSYGGGIYGLGIYGGVLPSGAVGSYTARIGGQVADVVQGSLNVVNQIGQRSTGGIKVWGPLGVRYRYGTHVQIFDDVGALVYSGFTTKDKKTKPGGARAGTGYIEHDIQLMDNVYKADKRRAKGSFLNQSAGSIVKALVDSILTQEGVTYTATSIAAGLVIIEAVWNYQKSCAEAIQWLATQCGYWWQIDVNGVLFFQPYTGIPAPIVLDGSQADALQDLSVEDGNDQYVNNEFVKGSYAEKGKKTAPLVSTFHGDGTTRSWTLSYPMSTLYSVTLNGSDVTTSVLSKGQNGGQFYIAQADPIIAQDPSQAVLQSSDTLVVSYAGRFPIVANARNSALITAQQAREGGGSGLVESSYSSTKVRTQSAAFQIATALLSHFGQDTTTLTFSTRTKGLAPGQMLLVNLPDFGLNNQQMLISSVGLDDQGPDGFAVWFRVTAVGSPIETAQWQTYWQALMNQTSDPSDLTDTSDGSALAFVLSSQVSLNWIGTVTPTKASCPICNNATLCNTTTTVC